MPYEPNKRGVFRDWTEDDEGADLFVPLPPGTVKKDLVCVITSEKLVVRHARLQKMLLCAEPLAGPVDPEQSTWYIEGDVVHLFLAKVHAAAVLSLILV